MTQEEVVSASKDYILHLISEADEFLREMNWKNHRKQSQDFVRSNMLEEWIDIFKYWLSLGLVWGFTPEDFLAEYERKSAVVEQRYKQEFQLDFLEGRIVGVDIDGVLAAYPDSYIKFVNQELGTNFNPANTSDYDIGRALGLPKEIQEELKDKYRQTGQKRFIPVLPGAKEFLERLRKEGYTIVLLSARPYKQYRRIFADTQEWLNNNGLVHDAILWDEDKCKRLLREFGRDRVEFFVEDHLENANQIAELGVPVYLFNRPYNVGKDTHNFVTRVETFNEIKTTRKGKVK